jgi:hypothetical protein
LCAHITRIRRTDDAPTKSPRDLPGSLLTAFRGRYRLSPPSNVVPHLPTAGIKIPAPYYEQIRMFKELPTEPGFGIGCFLEPAYGPSSARG